MGHNPNPALNTVVADGKGGIQPQVNPNNYAAFSKTNQAELIELAKEHEKSHIADLQAVCPRPGTDQNGRYVPAGTIIGFSDPAALGRSEVKATDKSLQGLQVILLKESDTSEELLLQKYIDQIQRYRDYNQLKARGLVK